MGPQKTGSRLRRTLAPDMLSLLRSQTRTLPRLAQVATPLARSSGSVAQKPLSNVDIPENEDMSTGLERKEELRTPDIFWSREPIIGHRGTKENPAVVPSFNDSRVVGLETKAGVIWFRLTKGPLHLVDGQYFKLHQIEGGNH